MLCKESTCKAFVINSVFKPLTYKAFAKAWYSVFHQLHFCFVVEFCFAVERKHFSHAFANAMLAEVLSNFKFLSFKIELVKS